MDHYFINTKPLSTGVNEVHKDGCLYIPNVTQRNYLGIYLTDKEAIKGAKMIYPNAIACIHCLNETYAKIALNEN